MNLEEATFRLSHIKLCHGNPCVYRAKRDLTLLYRRYQHPNEEQSRIIR